MGDRLQRIRDRHFDCYVDLARAAMESEIANDWLHVLDAELANIRAALEWGLTGFRAETAGFAASLLWYWRTRRLYNEGREVLDRVLRTPDLLATERMDAQLAAAWLASDQGDPEAARGHYEEAHRLAASAGDMARRARAAQGLGWSLFKLLLIADAVSAFAEARELSASLSLSERADVLRGLGWARGYNEGTEISLELHLEARRLLEEAGDPDLTSHYLVETNLLVGCGRVAEALALADKSVEFSRATGRPLSYALAAKSNAALASGDRQLLRQVLEEGIRVARVEKTPTVEAKFHLRLAKDAMEAGEIDAARDALDWALRLFDDFDVLDITDAGIRAELLVLRAGLAEDEGELDRAIELYRQAISRHAPASAHSHAQALVDLGRLHYGHGDETAAHTVEQRALALLDRIDADVGALVRIDFAVMGGDLDGALRMIVEGLVVAAERMPRDIPGLLWRKAAVLAELALLREAEGAAEELAATGLGGTTVYLERARVRAAAGDANGARSDLLQVTTTARAGSASHQIQLATTLARLALLEDRREAATTLWAAVQRYRAANKRLPPRLARRFEDPLRELPARESPPASSREALDALRRLVADEFETLAQAAGADQSG